jgi:hypothetical protein
MSRLHIEAEYDGFRLMCGRLASRCHPHVERRMAELEATADSPFIDAR